MNFIAMDFETANHLPYSACSLALVLVKDSKIAGEYVSYIQPETYFAWQNQRIHGIHPEDVANAPKFPAVWQEIRHYFKENRLIAAHNAAFDCHVLRSCLDYYHLERPKYLSICTVQSSRKLLPELSSHKLNDVCKSLAIPLEHHHDALEDSRACANILLYQEAHFGTSALKKMVKRES